MHNFLAGNGRLIREERWISNEHFKKNAANRPPINCLIITLLSKNFRSNVVGCSNCRKSKLPSSLVSKFFIECWFQLVKIKWKLLCIDFSHSRRSNLSMLTKAKISQFYMTVTVDQNIVGFQVPMNEVDLMDRLDGQDGLSNVKSTGFFTQDILSHEQRHEIATWKKVHDKVKVLIVLETIF